MLNIKDLEADPIAFGGGVVAFLFVVAVIARALRNTALVTVKSMTAFAAILTGALSAGSSSVWIVALAPDKDAASTLIIASLFGMIPALAWLSWYHRNFTAAVILYALSGISSGLAASSLFEGSYRAYIAASAPAEVETPAAVNRIISTQLSAAEQAVSDRADAQKRVRDAGAALREAQVHLDRIDAEQAGDPISATAQARVAELDRLIVEQGQLAAEADRWATCEQSGPRGCIGWDGTAPTLFGNGRRYDSAVDKRNGHQRVLQQYRREQLQLQATIAARSTGATEARANAVRRVADARLALSEAERAAAAASDLIESMTSGASERVDKADESARGDGLEQAENAWLVVERIATGLSGKTGSDLHDIVYYTIIIFCLFSAYVIDSIARSIRPIAADKASGDSFGVLGNAHVSLVRWARGDKRADALASRLLLVEAQPRPSPSIRAISTGTVRANPPKETLGEQLAELSAEVRRTPTFVDTARKALLGGAPRLSKRHNSKARPRYPPEG